jgi:hypothetical protein
LTDLLIKAAHPASSKITSTGVLEDYAMQRLTIASIYYGLFGKTSIPWQTLPFSHNLLSEGYYRNCPPIYFVTIFLWISSNGEPVKATKYLNYKNS